MSQQFGGHITMVGMEGGGDLNYSADGLRCIAMPKQHLQAAVVGTDQLWSSGSHGCVGANPRPCGLILAFQ